MPRIRNLPLSTNICSSYVYYRLSRLRVRTRLPNPNLNLLIPRRLDGIIIAALDVFVNPQFCNADTLAYY